jgi:NCAIR mutase (PurE)-related protein
VSVNDDDLAGLVADLATGTISPDEAVKVLRRLPFADLGFARVDHHRALRQGLPEAVYAPGKSPAQCAQILSELIEHDSGPVLLTRATPEQARVALDAVPSGTATPDLPTSDARGAERPITVVWRPRPERAGRVLVLTAGTADLPVAEECVVTLRAYGYKVTLRPDCGVAGLHRLLAVLDELEGCDVVVVVAGMEGALASVVGGITGLPVVAVPTSVGYGSSFAGVTALLAMLASCAAGVTVVGIDNGFGAASAVARILR